MSERQIFFALALKAVRLRIRLPAHGEDMEALSPPVHEQADRPKRDEGWSANEL